MSSPRTGRDTAKLKSLAARVVRSRWPRVVIALVLGVVVSLILFFAFQANASSQVEFEFGRDAHDRISAFKIALIHGLDTLIALDALFAADPNVDRAAFRAFTSKHLLEEPGVRFLGWAPRVSAEERDDFERLARREIDDRPEIAAAIRAFRIQSNADAPEAALPRSEYFPVYYAEPSQIAQHTLGYDLASDPVQREALNRSRELHRMAASRRAAVRPGGKERFGVLLLRPVYLAAAGSGASDSGAGRLKGFILGMFEVGAILDRAMQGLEPRGLEIAIHDLQSPPSESLLYFHESRLQPRRRDPWTREEALAQTDLALAETITVGDREWLISCRPADAYVFARRTGTPFLVLLAGLLLSVVVAGSLFAMLGREAETSRYARDLLAAKDQLEREAVERERARADLAASEERYRAAFGNAPIGTAAADLEGRFLQTNPALCRMLQYEEDELLRMSIADVVHPEDVDEEKRQLARLVAGDAESVQYVERLVRRDKTEIWAELNVSVVRDEAGQPLYFLGQQQDITERRRIGERVRQAQQTQAQILDSLPLNVFLKDSHGRMQFLNASGRKLLGLKPEEVVGKTDFDFFPEDEASALREIDLEAMSAGRAVSWEEKITLDGKTVHLLAGKTPIQVEGSDEPHLLGFSVDMTPIKVAEEALVRSEVRFRQLVENMSSGVAVYEAVDDGADFIFRDYNAAAEKMDGISREEVIGERLTETFPGAQEMGLLGLLQSVWRTGESRHLPGTLYTDSRLEGWRENYAYRLPSGEIVAIYDDVTDRKKLEDELLHAQKMEAIGRLAGGVAHDFNNLLQVVSGNTDLLLAGVADSGLRDTMLREIHEQAERGTQLVRRLLVFSRREAYSAVPIDLGEVLRGAETLVRRLLKENIDLVIDLEDASLPMAGDPGQLEQVLMNLVVNAADVLLDGGRLEIRSGSAGKEVWFSVADSGPGISEEMLVKVFDPYFTTKSATQGTGLGLAVVDGIVSVHGGRIAVDNRPGTGIEFKVFFPRAEQSPAISPPEQAAGTAPRGNGELVLVVEDQDLVRKTIEIMLTSLGYSVTTAANGGDARECAATGEYGLLVSDIVLPDTTGVELAQEFRIAKPDLAVLLVSGYAEESVRERGADFRFLQKPFRLEELARQAAEALAETPDAAG